MRRRDFIARVGTTAVAWPLAARAQQSERIRRIGVLIPNVASDLETKRRLTAFRRELERLGWDENRNVYIDYRFAGGVSDRYLPLARELIALEPDVIVAGTTPVTAILHRETRTIPIVFNSVSDPIGGGFVASLARPGGNLTGTLQYESGITGKWLALLKEIDPRLSRVALVGNPKTTPFDYFVHAAQTAALDLAIELVPAPIESADTAIKNAIGSFAAEPNGGLLVLPDTTTVVALAAQNRLPAVYPFRLFVDAGGLMAYGIDVAEAYRLSATFVDRILRGAKPADLPVQAPTGYETVVNLKTAKAIGLDVPPSLLVRADE
jgi:putative ABC transport system substrate-binding protein